MKRRVHKNSSNWVETDPFLRLVIALEDARRVVERAMAYCAVRDHPTPGQHESVEPFHYENLREAVKRFAGPKGSAHSVGEAASDKISGTAEVPA